MAKSNPPSDKLFFPAFWWKRNKITKLEFIFLIPFLLNNVKGFFAHDGPVYIYLFSSSSAFKGSCHHENWAVIPLSKLLHGVIFCVC